MVPTPLVTNKSFVGKDKSLVGKYKSLVGKDKSLVGKDKSFVGKDKSLTSPLKRKALCGNVFFSSSPERAMGYHLGNLRSGGPL